MPGGFGAVVPIRPGRRLRRLVLRRWFDVDMRDGPSGNYAFEVYQCAGPGCPAWCEADFDPARGDALVECGWLLVATSDEARLYCSLDCLRDHLRLAGMPS
jgi:hypothetical protein